MITFSFFLDYFTHLALQDRKWLIAEAQLNHFRKKINTAILSIDHFRKN